LYRILRAPSSSNQLSTQNPEKPIEKKGHEIRMVYEILREIQKTGYNYMKMETLSRNRKRDELGIER
jgi:hypothetical protein